MKRYAFTLIAVLLLAGQAMAQYTESPIAHLSRAEGTLYVGAGSGRIGTLLSSANARSLLQAENYAAMKTLLDLEIGTDVQAYSSTLASVANKKVDRLSQFVPYSGNPILEPEGTEAMAAFGSMWYESGTYHMYYMYWLSQANGAVGHATSPDGVTWTRDAANNPVFDRDDCAFSNFIRSATVWKEGSTWYLLYTGVRFGSSKDEVGLATSTNGVDFVQTGTEPRLTYDDGTWDQYGVEITSLIKVGATYYAYYESPEVYETQRPRHIGIATSTDLTTWTKDVANNPVVGGFCPFVFVYDDDYYMICPDYTEGSDFTEFRLYRDSAPTFYEDSRVDLGPIYGTSASGADKIDIDTPCILTDTIERNSFAASNNELWMYYASYGGTWTQSLAKARFGHFPSVSANTSRGVGIGRFNRIIVDDESTTRTNLGLEIGTDVQAYDADLTALAGITGVNGDVIIRSGDTWTRLAKGDDGQVLKLAAGLPSWAADTDTNTTYTGGDGLTLTETDFDLDLKTGGGLEIDTGQLTVTAPLLIGEIGLSWHGTAAEVIDDAVVCPYSGTITSVIITANASGSIELDVWKSASGVPTVADTICNASYPALSAAQQDKAISVAGWSSTAITAGDTIKFEVRSVTTITQATVQLVIAK